MSDDKINEEKLNNEKTEDEEEYVGRDWNKILMGVLFVFAATVTWYVIQAILGH
ncbi:MAG: hypothetical protein K9W46_10795 [Candidatus Heimdallarchaeum endolithica]|uniref:Uncharacterized protein n=1 Tax=Candidatus Heimdallarchaeum endolithica TaxID=2876572 RepID=A0A9Y1BPI2_9ARCH|nr:MAG: hypothetical protein K9W46_10795 [Candidatus Heimdallarchaeum endolithica]